MTGSFSYFLQNFFIHAKIKNGARQLKNTDYRSAIFIFILILTANGMIAQNLYDDDHSVKYGKYLLESGKYSLASEEFERSLFLNPDNDTVKYLLIRSYLLGNQFSLVTERIDTLFQSREMMPRLFAIEYTRSLIKKELNFNAEQFINLNRNFSVEDRYYLRLSNQLMGYEWDKAQLTYHEIGQRNISIYKSYEEIMQQIQDARYKSPALALGLSAIIPGLGKVYTNNWKDGLISFVFVAGSAIQAIRGYRNYGSQSAFFIVYSSVAATFYLGGLYGSLKSAKKNNSNIKKKLHAKMESVFNDTF